MRNITASTITLYHTDRLILITYPTLQYRMSSSNQQTFRSQLSGFRWANSVQDDSAAAASASAQAGPSNAFGRAWTGLSGYIPLRNEGRSQEEEAYFALSVSFRDHSSEDKR